MKLSRRDFVTGITAVGGVLMARGTARAQDAKLPVVVTTWSFGRKANGDAWKVLEAGGSAIDAVEKGINLIELDPDNDSVGFGGIPNEEGETTCDAMIMWGPKHATGAVGCLKRIKRPISVARKVLEKTRHTFLVGDDATKFAVKMGFKEEALGSDKSRAAYEAWKKDPKHAEFWNHDTIGMVAIDRNGDVCAGCSTSGLGWKVAGRVGDSPITGCGAYCDNDIGGAAATGNGDVMMRFCPSFHVVELMRQGKGPAEACAEALKRIESKGYKAGGALLAVDKKGRWGAAKMNTDKFACWVRNGSGDIDATVG